MVETNILHFPLKVKPCESFERRDEAACEFTSQDRCQRRADVPPFLSVLRPRLFRGISTSVTPTSLGRSDDVGLCDNETSLMGVGGGGIGTPLVRVLSGLHASHSACAILHKINPCSYSNPPALV